MTNEGYLWHLYDARNRLIAEILEGRGRSDRWFQRRFARLASVKDAINARRPASHTPLAHLSPLSRTIE